MCKTGSPNLRSSILFTVSAVSSFWIILISLTITTGNGIDIPGYAGPFNNFTNLPGWVPGTGGGCVTTGPFASYNLSLGPGTIPTNHCLTRAFSDKYAWALSSASVANITKQPTFETFRIQLEGQPITPTMKLHDGGHFAVGAEMLDTYSSPGGAY